MPDDTAEKFKPIGIGTAAIAALYASGFFVHFGESHLLGIDLPVAAQLEYLVLGGEFLFQSLQALLRPFLAPGSIPWLGDFSLSGYLIALLVFAAVIGAARLLGRSPRARSFAHFTTGLRALDVAAALAFAVIWILVLVEAFGYRDLLFPLRPEAVARERARFTQLTAPAAHLSAEQTAVQRRTYQEHALARELEARTDADNGEFERRLRAWHAWQEITPESKSLSFGWLTWITLGSLALLLLAFRGARTFPPLPRTPIAALLALLAVFQACLLPLNYGIALKRRDFPVVRVSKTEVPGLQGQTALFLGEADNRVYLYRDDALWTLHVVASSAIEGWQIEGRRAAPVWIHEFLGLPTGEHFP